MRKVEIEKLQAHSYGTIVTLKHKGSMRLAVVQHSAVLAMGKPGPGRYRYSVRPCSVQGGQLQTWGNAFALIEGRRHASLDAVSIDQATQLLLNNSIKAWA